MTIKRWASSLTLVVVLFLSACSGIGNSASGTLKASGTTSVTTTDAAPEIGGKIAAIKVSKGDDVKAGDVLFVLDTQLLQDQVDQASAAVQAAQANQDLAQSKLADAQAQLDLTSQAARQQGQNTNLSGWKTAAPGDATLPGWYFSTGEQITALQALVTDAQTNLDNMNDKLNNVLKDASNQDFVAAEQRLAKAIQAYNIAKTTHDDANSANKPGDVQDSAQKDLDVATSELTSAQNAYDQMLNSDEATRVLEARADVAVAQDKLNNTKLALDELQTGDQSLQVTAAQAALDQATNGVTAAKASLAQAQAALEMANTQLDKATVTSPVSGTVLDLPMNAGEVAGAGATVVEVGDLDQVTLDVYIPENQYGQVKLGMKADISVDSFPGKTFAGTVTYISDQAEFTPRTVQTVDSRSTTVYKVEITIPNPDHGLKPGMPADASIILQ
ncbi:MAG TPA: efflux RND transporter periplasmic adaptor subunit [Longilinea sp.]|nr:efflux RND transporter periplasmic adaptor subunit [Longilinea sp.]